MIPPHPIITQTSPPVQHAIDPGEAPSLLLHTFTGRRVGTKKKADKHNTGAMAESPEPIGLRGRDGLRGVVGFGETEMRRCRCRVRGRCQTGRAAGRSVRTQIYAAALMRKNRTFPAPEPQI